MLRDGTALFYGSFSLLTEDLSFSLPAETGDPPDFATLAAEYAAVLAGPPPGLPPDRGAEFELRIDTGDRPMPRSRPMKRLSQGELDSIIGGVQAANYSTLEQRMDCSIARLSRCIYSLRAKG